MFYAYIYKRQDYVLFYVQDCFSGVRMFIVTSIYMIILKNLRYVVFWFETNLSVSPSHNNAFFLKLGENFDIFVVFFLDFG